MSKAPRLIDPPSLLRLFQVLKFKRERGIFSQTHFKNPLSINARQGFGRELVRTECKVRETLYNGLLFGPEKKTVGGPGGINTPRSRTVTVIF
jgi:hypothetical protein